MHQFVYYIFVLIAIIVAFLTLKKAASCLIKSIVLIALIALLVFLYFAFVK